VIAHLLVTEGFTEVEEVAFVPLEDIAGIEGFDEDVANELRQRRWPRLQRAQNYRGLVKNADSARVVHKLILPSQSLRRKFIDRESAETSELTRDDRAIPTGPQRESNDWVSWVIDLKRESCRVVRDAPNRVTTSDSHGIAKGR